MKKFLTWLYGTFGVLNIMLFWLAAALDYDVGGDSWLNILVVTFLSSGIIMMRTPFSRKRVDHWVVSAIRWASASVMVGLGWKLYNTPDLVQDPKISLGIIAIVGISIFLLLTTKEIRREFIIKNDE